MSNKQRVTNPISGAAAIGLGEALAVTMGAAIRKNSIDDEALTVLAGGVITGAIIGTIGYCIPNTDKDSHTCLKIATAVLYTTLTLAALLTAPLMGEKCLKRDTKWGETVIDGLIGEAILIGAVATVAATYVGGSYCRNKFFSQSPPLSHNQNEELHAVFDII